MKQWNNIFKSVFFGLVCTLMMTGPALAQGEAPSQKGAFACLIGDHAGIDPADAQTATLLFCDDLRSRGVAVGQPTQEAGDAAHGYRLSLRPLGKTILVRVSYEAPIGTATLSRQVQILGIEKLLTAIPRLSEAVVKDISVERTARVDNLIGKETRRYEKTPGETFWGIGIVGMSVPGLDAVMQPGMDLRVFYERPRYSVGTNLRVAGGSGQDDQFFFIGWGMGGRYFFSNKNTSFFAGGGLSWTTLAVDRGDWNQADHFDGSESGFGAYAEIGVEFLRFHGSRMSLDLRVDAPMFAITDAGKSEYFLPISLGIQYAW